MSTSQRRPRATAAVAASLTALLGLLGASPLGPAQTAVAQDGAAPEPPFQIAADPTRIVDVGGGDRVAVTTLDDGKSVLTAMPGADGAVPGLVTERTDAGTSVQTTDPESVPTLIEGKEAPQVAAVGATVPLHFEVIGRDGRPANGHITVFDLEHGATWTRQLDPSREPGTECTADPFGQTSCALVPPGTYSVMAVVRTLPAEPPSIGSGRVFQNAAIVGTPETTVDAERAFSFDARDAEPVTVRTPGNRTKVAAQGMLMLGYDRTAEDGSGIHLDLHPNVLLDQHFYLQPTEQVTLGTFQTRARIRLEAPDIELSAPFVRKLHPEYVDRVWFADFASDFPVVDGTSRLRVVDVGHATPADLAGRKLRGALALVTRTDGVPVAEQSNRAAKHGASAVIIRNDGPGDNADPGGTGVMLRVPTIRLNRAEGLALARLPKKARVTVRGESASPYMYDLYLKEQGRVPDDLSYVARTQDLAAQVHELHGQPASDSTFTETAYPFQPGDTASYSRYFPFLGGARSRVEYRLPDPDMLWRYGVVTPENPENAMFPRPDVQQMSLLDTEYHVYAAPTQSTIRAGAAPVSPGPNVLQPVQRAGDRMKLSIQAFVDQDGNQGGGYSQGDYATHLEILADGVLIDETVHGPSGIVELPTGPSTVAVHFTTDNPQSWADLSTHTDTTWTFPSATTPAGQIVTERLLLPDYDVDVDLRNRVRSQPGTPVSFDLQLGQPEGASASPVRSVRVDASYDDGATWRKAKVVKTGNEWRVTLPPGTGYVSLRLRADDTAGSAVDQTVIRAFDVTR